MVGSGMALAPYGVASTLGSVWQTAAPTMRFRPSEVTRQVDLERGRRPRTLPCRCHAPGRPLQTAPLGVGASMLLPLSSRSPPTTTRSSASVREASCWITPRASSAASGSEAGDAPASLRADGDGGDAAATASRSSRAQLRTLPKLDLVELAVPRRCREGALPRQLLRERAGRRSRSPRGRRPLGCRSAGPGSGPPGETPAPRPGPRHHAPVQLGSRDQDDERHRVPSATGLSGAYQPAQWRGRHHGAEATMTTPSGCVRRNSRVPGKATAREVRRDATRRHRGTCPRAAPWAPAQPPAPSRVDAWRKSCALVRPRGSGRGARQDVTPAMPTVPASAESTTPASAEQLGRGPPFRQTRTASRPRSDQHVGRSTDDNSPRQEQSGHEGEHRDVTKLVPAGSRSRTATVDGHRVLACCNAVVARHRCVQRLLV